MDRLRTDVRFALRLLLRSPGWTAVAVLSLALGIGANAVVFSLLDAVLLEPFPYRDSGQLVLLWGSKKEDVTRGISGADLKDWREQSRSFEDIDAFLGRDMAFSLGASESDRVKGACIGHRVLPMLGVHPAVGRNFTEREAQFGGAPVVMISDALWRSRFAGSPSIVGSTIRLDDNPHEVIGITPPGFFFPDTDARLWVPAPCGMQSFEARGSVLLHAVGRMRAGVSAAQAQADLDLVNARLAKAFPDTNKDVTAGVFPLRHILIGKYERALWTLVWSIALVLLIACANVVHLQLARGVDRETELAVRAAAGAGRHRLLRQLLTESFLLVTVSAAIGLLVAWIGVRLIHAFALTDIPRMEYARIDTRVLAFTLAVSFVTAVPSGLWPAWKASAVKVSETLKLGATATTGASRSQVRDLLAITEIAAAVTLLVASGLVVKSFVQLSRADWGFNPENVLLIGAKAPRDRAKDRTFHLETGESIRARLETIPGVEQVAVSRNAPIRWGSWAPRPLAVDGHIPGDLTAAVWVVGRGHFAAAGIPIHEGREFTEADDAAAPRRVVVSRALAARLWPNQSALGKSLKILDVKLVDGKPDLSLLRGVEQSLKMAKGWPSDVEFFDVVDGVSWDVVGVASDVRMFGLNVQPNPALYIENRQQPMARGWFYGLEFKILLRTSGEPAEVIESAKTQILAASRDLTLTEIVPLADLVAQSIGGRGSNKLLVIVATVFGTLAITFATIGIYGVVAHNVTQRLREIGIRVALGASTRDVIRIVVGHGMRLLIGGLALGVTAAWAATRGMSALLFATTPTDAVTYAGVIATLVAAALLACVLPLRRALRFDSLVLFKA